VIDLNELNDDDGGNGGGGGHDDDDNDDALSLTECAPLSLRTERWLRSDLSTGCIRLHFVSPFVRRFRFGLNYGFGGNY
jgi:hypothetical protein